MNIYNFCWGVVLSDFIYVSNPREPGQLKLCIAAIYSDGVPEILEFRGAWGGLAVSKGHYSGFGPLETESHICIVLGGPVLNFCQNSHEGSAGTSAVLERWLKGKLNPESDLSGPFTLLIINKAVRQVVCITDLLMFIPVYRCELDDHGALGSHVDALSKACLQTDVIDETSLADFVLNHTVTFPYTIYRNIRQCSPGAIHRFSIDDSDNVWCPDEENHYWLPVEKNNYASIGEASIALRAGVSGYINRLTSSMTCVAHFISAGEDSRAIAGMLPSGLKRDAYIFLDSVNREGKIAEKVAELYEANFRLYLRDPMHYLRIIPEASRLVGSGSQYKHAHTYGISKVLDLQKYSAVFGGQMSDTLLKCLYGRRHNSKGVFSFLPDFPKSGETRSKKITHPHVPQRVLTEITERRRNHLARVQKIRPDSAHEWFGLWPATMYTALAVFHTNRRLFSSYEPFMCSEVVKISAGVPAGWKLNRSLFHRAFKPFFSKSRWVLHASGHMPYLPWWANKIVAPVVNAARAVKRKLSGETAKNEGPWGDWGEVMKTDEWADVLRKCEAIYGGHAVLQNVVDGTWSKEHVLNRGQRINFVQSCFLMTFHKK
ncbi:MAG: hypothetical protein ACRDD3_13270 [Azovibrio sp.]